MLNTEIELMPYLQFQGNCEEALHFYKDILDGRIEIISRYDNPAMNAPEDFKNKILHAAFYFGRYQLFASDMMPKNAAEVFHPNISMSLGLHDEDAGKVCIRQAERREVKFIFHLKNNSGATGTAISQTGLGFAGW